MGPFSPRLFVGPRPPVELDGFSPFPSLLLDHSPGPQLCVLGGAGAQGGSAVLTPPGPGKESELQSWRAGTGQGERGEGQGVAPWEQSWDQAVLQTGVLGSAPVAHCWLISLLQLGFGSPV